MFRTEGLNNLNGQYKETPPATVIEAMHLNAIQEEICAVIESAGGQVRQKGNNVNTQLFNALQTYFFQDMFDVVVTNQTQFNALFERTGANAYKIKDTYRSVFIKNNGVGYACIGATSFIAGGDSYAVISTNYCAHLVMQSGSYMDVGNERGYLIVNTDDCVLDNVWIKGTGTVASAIQYSFLLNAYRVTYNNCKSSNRLSNVAFYCFQGSGTALHNISSKYINCISYNLYIY